MLDAGFVGLSYGKVRKNYGLPLGTHVHAGHDEHDEEEGVEEGVEESAEESAEEEHHEEVEKVRIAMQTERWEFKTQWDLSNNLIQQLEASASYTEYKHQELEYFVHEEHEDEHEEHEEEHSLAGPSCYAARLI